MLKKVNYKNKIFFFFILILFFSIIINSNSISIGNNINTFNQNYVLNIDKIPKLAWHPKSHNFGYVHEGNIYNTTFEIWNNGTGILEWSLQIKDDWVEINPKSGNSTGEHDLINVSINTKDLLTGIYEGNVYIHSEGDYIFYTYFNITDRKLEYYPKIFDLGVINQNNNKTIYFEIWNEGEGILNWSLESSSNLINLNLSNGSSENNHTIIKIIIAPSYLYSGYYNETVDITSNGGNGKILLNFTINNPPNSPLINGKKIIKKNEIEVYEIYSYDPEDHNISYYVEWGDNTFTNWSDYLKSGDKINLSKKWNKIGNYTIRIKSKDIFNYESDWSLIKIQVPKNNNLIINKSLFY